MMRKAVAAFLVLQLVVLCFLVAIPYFNSSPIFWTNEGDYGIETFSYSSADEPLAKDVNTAISEILSSYPSPYDYPIIFYFSLARREKNLTILEIHVLQGSYPYNPKDDLVGTREQLWVHTDAGHPARIVRVTNPQEFFTYSQIM